MSPRYRSSKSMSMSGIGLPAGVQEALEDQPVANRVEVDDAQAVRDAAPGRGPAARSDTNALLAGVSDEVPHHEEVVRESHVGDDAELVLESRATSSLRCSPYRSCAPRSSGRAATGWRPLCASRPELLGDRELGQRVVVELDRDVGALGDPQGVVTGLGDVTKEVAHLGGGLQVVLVAVESEAVRVRDQ